MDSPPKRVTRARAAAKKDDVAAPKPSRAATAAKPKATRTTATTKRKTRADEEKEEEEQRDEEDIIEPKPAPAKTTRGRPKRAATAQQDEDNEMVDAPAPVQVKATRGRAARSESEQIEETTAPAKTTRARAATHSEEDIDMAEAPAPAPAKSTRGRAARSESEQIEQNPAPVKAQRGRTAHTETEHTEETPAPAKSTRGRPKKVVIETPAAETARTTRGRAKKVDAPQEEPVTVEEPVKKTTRGRAATLTKTAPKKTVKFQEPGQENVIPAATKEKKEAEVGTGLRAKPVRKPATAATRATRGRAKVEEKSQGSSPLSPKKVTQVGATKEGGSGSDDELSTTIKTPMKPLMKSPVKPTGSIFNNAKKLDFSTSNSLIVNRMTSQDLSSSVMASPARRPPPSAFKESTNSSPQKASLQGSMLSQSPFKLSLAAPKQTQDSNPSLKASLLQSPARRPVSPTKVNDAGSPTRTEATNSLPSATPKATHFKISRFTTPRTLNLKHSVSRPGQSMAPPSAPPKFYNGSPQSSGQDEDSTLKIQPLEFSGRLSAIVPRSADPALVASEPIMEEVDELAQPTEQMSEDMDVDQAAETIVVEDQMEADNTTPPCSPPRHSTGGSFELRQRDESPFDDSDSEDELASESPRYSPVPIPGFEVSAHDFASSPMPFQSISTPKAARSARPSLAATRSEKKEKIGFTPLATQLSNWMAASPEKPDFGSDTEEPVSPTPSSSGSKINADAIDEPSPAKSHFFDDEMSVRDEMASAPEPEEIQNDVQQDLTPLEPDEEDIALADEADEMSLLQPNEVVMPDQDGDLFEMIESEPQAVEQEPVETSTHEQDFQELQTEQQHPEPAPASIENQTFEQALSEASQEYGDENVPIDPALLITQAPTPAAPAFATPRRILTERTFHTVSKVPLKAAAEDSPMRPSTDLRRSASISRLPAERPTSNLARKNTVISYSPTKSTPRAKTPQQGTEDENEDNFATPSKISYSTVATPARTPRRDLNTSLLKGAVVFVDVHTTEGADAGVLFTELLTEMGARCVKTWNWNGNGEDGSKIGITHVVFKDGGKRTLEKARETNGVVSCVGVGWVLE